jgi:hypothetical protein
MATPLHKAAEDLAGEAPALVFSAEAFRGFVLNNFVRAFGALEGQSFPIEGYPDVELRLASLSVDPRQFQTRLDDTGSQIVCHVDPDFTAHFVFHVAGDNTREFSTLVFQIDNLFFPISVAAPFLKFSPPDYVINTTLTDAATRQDSIDSSNVVEQELIRIEGAFSYVMPRRIVDAALSTLNQLDLSEHFTAFRMLGEWTPHLIGDAMMIIPAGGIEFKQPEECPDGDSLPDLTVEPGGRTNPTPDNYTWPINVGGNPGPTVHPANDTGDGFASLYMPKPLLESRFSKVNPGFAYRESGGGFIGYEAAANVWFEYLDLTIDPARFGIVVDLAFAGDGSVYANVDVPCVGRSDLGYARFAVARSELSILISFAISKEGKLVLKASIDRLVIGDCTATVSLFSRYLAMAGGQAAVIGFLLDYVLKRIVEDKIPGEIRKAIKKEVNKNNTKIIDLASLTSYTRYDTFNQVCYSGNQKSVLVGLMSNG